MPTLPLLKSALAALAYRIRSLSRKERERLGRREMDEIDAMVQLGRDDAERFSHGPDRAEDLARLGRLLARVSSQFERLLSEPTRPTEPSPGATPPPTSRRDPDDARRREAPPPPPESAGPPGA